MPKILRPLDHEVAPATNELAENAGARQVDVEQTAAFPEPDHSPEISAVASYERRRTVSLRGIVEEEPDRVDGQETGEEAGILGRWNSAEIPGRPLQLTAAIPTDVDQAHDCDLPSHEGWFILWSAEHNLPLPRDYRTCTGYQRRLARTMDSLRALR